MSTIEVDFEVFKELTARRSSESVTENDILRSLLGLNNSSSKRTTQHENNNPQSLSWVVKGVTFPHGTEFRTTYKGQQYAGKVESGALLMNGRRFSSPSAAAMSITGHAVNGWRFWECRLPEASRWVIIASLRR